MLGSCPRGGGEQPQGVLAAGGQLTDGRGGCFSFYHVPQQCRREKLRYANAAEAAPPLFMRPSPSSHMLNPHYNTSPYDHGFPPLDLFNPNPLLGGDGSDQHQGQGFSLSLSSAVVDDQQHHHGQAQGASPMAGPPSVVSAVQRVGPVPAGPFTGYATILNSSRFLRPAQQLLEETCGGGVGGSLVGSGDEVEALDIAGDIPERTDTLDGVIGGGEQRRMKSRLILMLDEVYRRYKQYYHQIQAVISSFEAVSGLSMAAPYAPLALRSLSKHFKSLKNVVAEQLRFASKCVGKEGQSGEDIPSYRLASNAGLCFPRVAHCSGAVSQQPAWRPQRGLPERAVSVLRSWLFEHFLHPYPTDMDKQMLAKQTGLSRNQVSNWFINARVRLWKPMVEEIHSLEQQHDHRKAPQSDSSRGANKQPELLTSPSAVSAATSRRLLPSAARLNDLGLNFLSCPITSKIP
ncbi:unnamed protein product [Spirodela intermedia]|uniref:Homeobox domain-containing protein n=1 Tax=Spirodela intermedia TaxID=51605 RepID=A0A7I8IFY3_SPIIN|nr:unnamed protein product [Spirodela intermedia]CAA6656778.1 unnamed protein product [Spirodela intermedia]